MAKTASLGRLFWTRIDKIQRELGVIPNHEKGFLILLGREIRMDFANCWSLL